jgi:hypothetical protein
MSEKTELLARHVNGIRKRCNQKIAGSVDHAGQTAGRSDFGIESGVIESGVEVDVVGMNAVKRIVEVLLHDFRSQL